MTDHDKSVLDAEPGVTAVPSVDRKWRVDDTDGELEVVVDQDKYESIATVWVGAAEAHMLAAAPELYAALNDLLDYHNEGRIPEYATLRKAEAALAKAVPHTDAAQVPSSGSPIAGGGE